MRRARSRKFKKEFALWQKNFGVVVQRLRKEAGLSRPELARMAKFSVSTLETIEQGHGNLKFHPTHIEEYFERQSRSV